MPTTLRNTDILFNDSTTQSTAAVKAVRTKIFSSSITYTTPSGVTALAFFVSGSTGGQGNPSGAQRGGTGGAGYSEKYIASPAASYVITIGAAGSSGGGAGGTTTVDTISITGGSGVTGTGGSAGGVASGGGFNANGGSGGTAGGGVGGGGGGGAGGSRAGNGFAGGNGSGSNFGGGGGGGGTGAVGAAGGGASGGAGGAGATTTNASAITLNPYWVPASGAFNFNAGLAGTIGDGTNYAGDGGAGANGIIQAGTYGLVLYGATGGKGGNGFGATGGYVGQSGIVQIWEFY